MRVARGRPLADPLKQGPIGQLQVPIQRYVRIVWSDPRHRLLEDLLNVQVDGPGRPVMIDVQVEGELRVQESHQGRLSGLVQGQPLRRKKRVQQQPLDIHHIQRESGHKGISLNVIKVIYGIDPGEERAERLQPLRHASHRARFRLLDQERDLPGIESLIRLKRPAWAAANRRDDPSQLLHDNGHPQNLVIQSLATNMKLLQEVIVEEMSKGAVSDIMKQSGKPEQLFDERRRRQGLPECLLQTGIQVSGERTGHVHSPKDMLEPTVFAGWVDPPRTLQLMNTAQSLDPWTINDLLLSPFRSVTLRDSQEDIAVDRVGHQRHAFVG